MPRQLFDHSKAEDWFLARMVKHVQPDQPGVQIAVVGEGGVRSFRTQRYIVPMGTRSNIRGIKFGGYKVSNCAKVSVSNLMTDGDSTQALELLDLLVANEISNEEFFQRVSQLSEAGQELLARMLLQQYWEAKAVDAGGG